MRTRSPSWRYGSRITSRRTRSTATASPSGSASTPARWTAGIIGTHKFAYDLWGDTVNTASRMESEGVPGSIQVSGATYELIKDAYACETRGPIAVKGKAEMTTYLIISKRDAPGAGDPGG